MNGNAAMAAQVTTDRTISAYPAAFLISNYIPLNMLRTDLSG
jgi:hypothetical protein